MTEGAGYLSPEYAEGCWLEDNLPPRVNERRRFLRVLVQRKIVAFGLIVILAVLIGAIFAPWVAPFDPYDQDTDSVLSGPSSQHILGTDAIGRDTLSRIIYGTRIALLVGVLTVAFAGVSGSLIGLVAGFFGGWTYSLIMRLTDAVMAFPPILLALTVAGLVGSGMVSVVLAIGLALMPGFVRLMCGQVLSVKENEYVMAARSIGASNVSIMFRYILPNCLSPLIVQITMLMGVAILIEAVLSFLGVGIAPPTAAWGAMVYDGYQYLLTNPVLAVAPGLAIMIVVFAFNMIGDGLRDAIDPRLRGVL